MHFLPVFLCIVLATAGCASNSSKKQADAHVSSSSSTSDLPGVEFCQVPDPEVPSSAFDIHHSETKKDSGYWVRYQCKQSCPDWRQCLVPAYSADKGELLINGRQPDEAKQALAFVIDGMGGHIALTKGGNKTVFIHTGAGGTRYYAKPAATLEQRSSAKTVMMRWEKGYTASVVQPPFTQPITWGWYSRTSGKASNIKELNKRVASIIAWSHDNLSNSALYGTLGCSMGTNATFGPVLWHGLDPIIDYQLFVGGPNMWDLNAQCGRRQYTEGFCDVDGVTACKSDNDCRDVGEDARCKAPGKYTTIDKLFEQLPNHIHVTNACDIRATDDLTQAFAPFDSSSMGFSAGADWEIDHPMDFLVNLGAKQGDSYKELGGDEYWALGHFPQVFNKIKPDTNKSWTAIPDTHHCGAMFNEAIELIKSRMGL
jgi:hypothetical protein